jgi:hypothetical protein
VPAPYRREARRSRDTFLGEAGALEVADIRLRQLQRPPVSSHFQTVRFDHHKVLIDPVCAAADQQLLDDHLGHRVLALAEVIESDPAFLVGDVQRRTEMVREGAPNAVSAVEGDRVLHTEAARQEYRRSGTDGHAAHVTDTVERMTGRAPRSLDQLLAEQARP